MSGTSPATVTFALVLLGSALSFDAHARSDAAPFSNCSGCHNGTANPPEITLELNPSIPAPGETVTGQVTIKSSGMSVTGFYLTSEVGTLATLGQGTQMAAGGITHDSPLSASGGQAQFSFEWALPAEAGGTALIIRAIAANDDGRSQGDTAGSAFFPVAWGCDLVMLYADLDRDGFGTENYGISGGCGPREGWAATPGDCNENYATIFPGAEEVCNERDDDCDGEIDEGTVPRELYIDADGDGFGLSGDPMLGCVPPPGYAELDGDCDDQDAARHPEFAEVCDNKDNDCNERVDEGARLRCGTGWCERLASSCNSECFPGEPRAEECNAFDDDCDGVIDNDASGCGVGLVCYAGTCILPEDAAVVSELPDDGPSPAPGPNPTPGAGPAPNGEPPSAVPTAGSPVASMPGAPTSSGNGPPAPIANPLVPAGNNDPTEGPAEAPETTPAPEAAPTPGETSSEVATNTPMSETRSSTPSCQLVARGAAPRLASGILLFALLLFARRNREISGAPRHNAR